MNMMNRKMILRKQFKTALIAGAMSLTALAFGACGNNTSDSTSTSSQTAGTSYSSALAASTNFTERDLEQSADTTDAVNVTLNDGEVYTISDAGVYVLSGSYTDTTIVVDADDSDKVQLVVDGLTITNSNLPAVLVKNADKVFVTTTDAGAELTVVDKYSSYDDIDTDAVIYSKADLVLNGTGTLKIVSEYGNGISTKDDFKMTGGTLDIECKLDAVEAHDSIAICDGDITIKASKDGLHSEDSDDDTVGSIYISGGTFNIDVDGDAIQATTTLVIDGGNINIANCGEGLESTYVEINDGTISINASDDGINASDKSSSCNVVIKINGGTITINMGQGDTDAIDSNGDLYINGGTIDITANSPFDYDGTGELNGGDVTTNGTSVTELTNQMMGGGGMGGPGGQMSGRGGNRGGMR